MSEFTNKFKNMRYFKILLLTLFIINFSCDFQKTNEISESEISLRANEILNIMTLEEKVGQMTQIDQRFLDTIKFNLLANQTNKKIVSLGGINSKNLRNIYLTRSCGIASISWIKKNGLNKNLGRF